MLNMALEPPTSPSEQLCYDSYTLAQGYVEWRLEGFTDDSTAMLLQQMPTDISKWIVLQGEKVGEDFLDAFPEDVYDHCVRMWNESRKFIITF